jgi:hypothetical protein
VAVNIPFLNHCISLHSSFIGILLHYIILALYFSGIVENSGTALVEFLALQKSKKYKTKMPKRKEVEIGSSMMARAIHPLFLAYCFVVLSRKAPLVIIINLQLLSTYFGVSIVSTLPMQTGLIIFSPSLSIYVIEIQYSESKPTAICSPGVPHSFWIRR